MFGNAILQQASHVVGSSVPQSSAFPAVAASPTFELASSGNEGGEGRRASLRSLSCARSRAAVLGAGALRSAVPDASHAKRARAQSPADNGWAVLFISAPRRIR